MMTNPTAVLFDDDGLVRASGTWEEVEQYVAGYADAVIDRAYDDEEAEEAERQAFRDWLDTRVPRVIVDPTLHDEAADDWDNDDFLNGVGDVPAEVSIAQVVDANTVDPTEEWDRTEVYADVILPTSWETFLATGHTPDTEDAPDDTPAEELAPSPELEPVS